MVGLPGSGKSCWARTHTKQHPDKLYRLLGTEELLSCMIVSQTAALCSGTMIICILCAITACMFVCLDWWTEGASVAAGCSMSDRFDQASCTDSWQLHS